MNNKITIAIDAMGGENAPNKTIHGLSIFLETNKTKNDLINFYKGQNFSGFKDDLTDALIEKIYPIGLEIKKLMDDKKYLDSVLSNGNEKAKSKASKTINEIYDIVGFIRT